MPRTVTTVRLTDAARRELEWLVAHGYESLSAAIEAALHRLYEADCSEIPNNPIDTSANVCYHRDIDTQEVTK